MKNVRFAIIGCGRIAQRHAEHIAGKGELVAVCDIVKERADALANSYGAKAFYEIAQMLAEKDIEVVAVCTPNGLHAEHTIKALQAGYHVLCEKPMAISSADCREMIKASGESGKQLFIVKQNRFNPPVAAVKQAIEGGKLGRLFSLQLNCFWNRDEHYYMESDWKGSKKLDGGILYTQFSHFIDLLHWMAGDVKTVNAMMANFAHQGTIQMEDSGVVLLEFESGAIGAVNYTVNSHGKNMEGSLTIFGEKGTVKIGGQYLNELEYQDIHDFKIRDLPVGNTANNYGTYQGSMSNHDKVYANVIDVLTKNAAMSTNAYDGLKTVEIIEKIYEQHIRFIT
jgi:UDP-N-acetyl-2-amino-2-deoxyglucuronate dehydrogenase